MEGSTLTGRLGRSVTAWLGRYRSRNVLLWAFALLLIGTVGFTTTLLVRHEERVVQGVLEQVAERVHRQLRGEIIASLRQPDALNRHVVQALEAGRVEGDDDAGILRLLHDAPLQEQGRDAVWSLYLGLADGRFFGYGANPLYLPEVGERFTYAGPRTAGRYVNLEVLEDGTPGDVFRRRDAYDPRERPWYRHGESTVRASWTPPYEDFVATDNPVLTRVWPWRSQTGELLGVAGVDLFLRHFQTYLDERALGESGEAFVMQRDGTLIAASGAEPDRSWPARPIVATAAPYRYVRAAAREIRADGTLPDVDGFDRREHRMLDGEAGFLLLSPVAREVDLDWTIGIFLPEREYLADRVTRFGPVVSLGLLVSGISLLAFFVFVSLVVRPLRQLYNGARRIAVGDFDVPIDTFCRNEVGDLARAIDDMRDRLRETFTLVDTERATLATTLETIEDGVIMLDGEGKTRYLNRTAARVTGVDREAVHGAVIGSFFRARCRGSSRGLTHADLLRMATDSEHEVHRATVIDDVGMPHDIRLRVSPINRREAGTPGLLLNFRVASESAGSRSATSRSDDPFDALVERGAFEQDIARLVTRSRLEGVRHVLALIECLDEPNEARAGDPSAGAGRVEASALRDSRANEIGVALLELEPRHGRVSRFEPELFAVVFPDRTVDDTERRLRGLRTRLAQRVSPAGIRRVSISVVEIDEHSASVDEVLQLARSRLVVARGSNRLERGLPGTIARSD